jgi:hypothetical protein
MTITSTSTDTLLQLLQSSQESQTRQTNSLASLLPVASDASSSSTSSASSLTNDSSSVSNLGQLFSELEQLSKQNPAEFKTVTEQIAQQLQAAAKNPTDASESNALSQLAGKFEAASKSESISDLFPTGSQATGSISQASSQSYGASTPAGTSSSDDTLNNIFARALSQIQSYYADSSSTNNA